MVEASSEDIPVAADDTLSAEPARPSHFAGLMWWTTLVVAVMAVPLVGASAALALTDNAMMQMLLFMLTCWLCIWLGMWLVRRADLHDQKHRRP